MLRSCTYPMPSLSHKMLKRYNSFSTWNSFGVELQCGLELLQWKIAWSSGKCSEIACTNFRDLLRVLIQWKVPRLRPLLEGWFQLSFPDIAGHKSLFVTFLALLWNNAHQGIHGHKCRVNIAPAVAQYIRDNCLKQLPVRSTDPFWSVCCGIL